MPLFRLHISSNSCYFPASKGWDLEHGLDAGVGKLEDYSGNRQRRNLHTSISGQSASCRSTSSNKIPPSEHARLGIPLKRPTPADPRSISLIYSFVNLVLLRLVIVDGIAVGSTFANTRAVRVPPSSSLCRRMRFAMLDTPRMLRSCNYSTGLVRQHTPLNGEVGAFSRRNNGKAGRYAVARHTEGYKTVLLSRRTPQYKPRCLSSSP